MCIRDSPYNMLTVPAMTVPAGFTADGRPVGLQIAARHRQDALRHRVALALQQRRSWLDRMPGCCLLYTSRCV